MSSPVTPFETQNTHDDDGAVIDSLLQEVDKAPPAPLDPIPVLAPVEPPVFTRVLAGTEYINPNTDPFQLLAPDANRVETQIDVVWGGGGAATATDYINVGSESGPVSGAAFAGSRPGAYRIYPGGGKDFDAHTGALYIGPSFGQTGQLIVTWRVVSK